MEAQALGQGHPARVGRALGHLHPHAALRCVARWPGHLTTDLTEADGGPQGRVQPSLPDAWSPSSWKRLEEPSPGAFGGSPALPHLGFCSKPPGQRESTSIVLSEPPFCGALRWESKQRSQHCHRLCVDVATHLPANSPGRGAATRARASPTATASPPPRRVPQGPGPAFCPPGASQVPLVGVGSSHRASTSSTPPAATPNIWAGPHSSGDLSLY